MQQVNNDTTLGMDSSDLFMQYPNFAQDTYKLHQNNVYPSNQEV